MLYKLYSTFCISMGMYGISRGYRSVKDTKKLALEKTGYSIMNGLMYATPICNTIPFIRLLNRVEIEYYDLDKTYFGTEYTEFGGNKLFRMF